MAKITQKTSQTDPSTHLASIVLPKIEGGKKKKDEEKKRKSGGRYKMMNEMKRHGKYSNIC